MKVRYIVEIQPYDTVNLEKSHVAYLEMMRADMEWRTLTDRECISSVTADLMKLFSRVMDVTELD